VPAPITAAAIEPGRG